MRVHLFVPNGEGRFPGVVLYSEIFQMTSPIRRMAAALAGEGYLVSVPEVYHEFEAPAFTQGSAAFGLGPPRSTKLRDCVISLSSDFWHYLTVSKQFAFPSAIMRWAPPNTPP